jgi:methylamine--corrinoid protein Co-methyltransferase
MVRARRLQPIDVYNRAITGPKVDEKTWDFKIIPEKTAEKVKKYGIKIDPETWIPDADMADRIYHAGREFLAENGFYVIDTGRVIKVTDDEITDGLKHAPRELTLGAGRDAAKMYARKVGTDSYERKPVIQGGPTGAPLSEQWFLQVMTSYAQEGVVDTIVNGVLSTWQGWEVTPGSVQELKAVKAEQQLIRLACSNAGRPGMAI